MNYHNKGKFEWERKFLNWTANVLRPKIPYFIDLLGQSYLACYFVHAAYFTQPEFYNYDQFFSVLTGGVGLVMWQLTSALKSIFTTKPSPLNRAKIVFLILIVANLLVMPTLILAFGPVFVKIMISVHFLLALFYYILTVHECLIQKTFKKY